MWSCRTLTRLPLRPASRWRQLRTMPHPPVWRALPRGPCTRHRRQLFVEKFVVTTVKPSFTLTRSPLRSPPKTVPSPSPCAPRPLKSRAAKAKWITLISAGEENILLPLFFFRRCPRKVVRGCPLTHTTPPHTHTHTHTHATALAATVTVAHTRRQSRDGCRDRGAWLPLRQQQPGRPRSAQPVRPDQRRRGPRRNQDGVTMA